MYTSEFDAESAAQDVDNPVWPSMPVEPDVQTLGPGSRSTHHAQEVPAIRNIEGALDFLSAVTEDLTGWLMHSPEAEEYQRRRRETRPHVLDTFGRPSKSWRAVSMSVGATGSPEVKINGRYDRTFARITNLSATANLYVGHDTGSSLGAATLGQITIPPLAATSMMQNWRDFPTQADIYVFPAIPGTAQAFDVAEFYGFPEFQ